jgi:hypothetical protein
MDWKDAARGIGPWPGSHAISGGHAGIVVDVRDGACLLATDSDRDGVPVWETGCLLDLEDADTRAMFDRRLALRLGAPAEAVEQGVMVVCVRQPNAPEHAGGCYQVIAGVWDRRWARSFTDDDFTIPADPLLFRALAWREMEPR